MLNPGMEMYDEASVASFTIGHVIKIEEPCFSGQVKHAPSLLLGSWNCQTSARTLRE